MAAGFALDIDMSEALARAPDILSAARQELDRAADRALTKTAKWLRTHSAREIGRELSIIQRPIRVRFKVYPVRGDRATRLWIGLDPLAVHYLGTPRQTPTGVSVGRHDYRHAFVDPMKSRSPMVWRRKGRERLPIEKVTEDWQDIAQPVIQRWERRATARFAEIFEQEARYVLSRD